MKAIKLNFHSADDALYTLKRKSNIPRDKFPNISIKTDLNPRQTENVSNLREELQRRQQEGKRSFNIKYIKNVPQIISTTSKRTRDEDDSPKRMNGTKISNLRWLSLGNSNYVLVYSGIVKE
ncbi:hypothetical protein JTB14_015673 [Gonioctena quinquepunctata]|nr:hypothetical protein JTB14_015673 [Gonioctena quinquepunctata]